MCWGRLFYVGVAALLLLLVLLPLLLLLLLLLHCIIIISDAVLQSLMSTIIAIVIGIVFLELDLSFEGIQNRSVFNLTVTHRNTSRMTACCLLYYWGLEAELACVVGDISRRHTVEQSLVSLLIGIDFYVEIAICCPAPARWLRSSAAPLLIVQRTRTDIAGRAFSVAAPSVWNSLPLDIRHCDTTAATFKRHLKTHLFSQT